MTEQKKDEIPSSKIKTRQGSGYLKQLYSTARTTAGTTHSHLKNLTTLLVNFIPIDQIDSSKVQVRVHFDETEIQALAQSIRAHGILQPILVIQTGERYQVIAGERRLRASQLAGLERIPARMLSNQDPATQEIALRENLDRIDLHPIEEGEGYLALLEAQTYLTHEAIAKAFGKPKSRITECIGFTRLPDSTKSELLQSGVKNRALLRQLLTLAPEKQLIKVQEALGKEEVFDLSGMSQKEPGILPTSAPSKASSQAPEKLLSYQVSNRRVAVPKFRWKKSEGPDRLKSYIEELKKLLSELEALT